MRMFVALVPAEHAVRHLEEFLEPRRAFGADLRWTDPEQWHVTLAFMAQVPDRIAESLPEALSDAAAPRAPMPLAVRGGGAFPSPQAARVLWAGVHQGEASQQGDRQRGDDEHATTQHGVSEDAQWLGRLARSVRRACSHAGAAPAGGHFHPHITVARSRQTEATRWIRLLEGYSGPAWRASELVLFGSHLGQGRGRRPRHEVLATIPLGAT